MAIGIVIRISNGISVAIPFGLSVDIDIGIRLEFWNPGGENKSSTCMEALFSKILYICLCKGMGSALKGNRFQILWLKAVRDATKQKRQLKV